MAMKQFKSESKRLLDMMINSIYTHKEIYLRELISNASDAIDKLYYLALTDENIKFNREDFYIRIASDKFARKIIITDTGIGMTENEVKKYICQIALSGALDFIQKYEGDAAGWDAVPTDYVIEQQSVTSDTLLELHLAPGGGFAIAIK